MNFSKFFDKLGNAKPFAWAAILWAFVAVAIVMFNCPDESRIRALEWMGTLWALCLIDLITLAKALQSAILAMDGAGENRIPHSIQAFYWGAIKLVCLGLFGFILWQSARAPTVGLLTGLGTLVVVPLLGGFWRSKQILSEPKFAE
jgi:hypothetical protein